MLYEERERVDIDTTNTGCIEEEQVRDSWIIYQSFNELIFNESNQSPTLTSHYNTSMSAIVT